MEEVIKNKTTEILSNYYEDENIIGTYIRNETIFQDFTVCFMYIICRNNCDVYKYNSNFIRDALNTCEEYNIHVIFRQISTLEPESEDYIQMASDNFCNECEIIYDKTGKLLTLKNKLGATKVKRMNESVQLQ